MSNNFKANDKITRSAAIGWIALVGFSIIYFLFQTFIEAFCRKLTHLMFIIFILDAILPSSELFKFCF